MPNTTTFNTDHLLHGRVIGEIPEDIIARKYEKSVLYEDPDLLRNYQRETLRDQSADPINTFASGGKRNNGGYNEDEIALAKKQGIDLPKATASNGAMRSTVLNIRTNGQRSTIQPRHSEAFLELTGADPRGHSNLPDMRKLVEHSYARAGDHRLSFKNDDDLTIHESARNSFRVSSDKKMAMNASKQKLQIFNESETTWGANSGNMFKSAKTISDVTRMLNDQNTLDIADQEFTNRRSNVTLLSNTLPGGWSQETDHKVAIGKYSKIYSGYGKTVDINRHSTVVDPLTKSRENNYLPSSVVHLMNKQIKARVTYQDTLPPSNKFWGKPMDTEGFRAGSGSMQESVQEKVKLGLQSMTRQKDKQVKNKNKTMKISDGRVDKFTGSNEQKTISIMRKAVENINKQTKQTIGDIRNDVETLQKMAKSQVDQVRSGVTAVYTGQSFDHEFKGAKSVEVKKYTRPMIINKGGVNMGVVDDAERGVMTENHTLVRKPNVSNFTNKDSFDTVDENIYSTSGSMDKRRGFKKIETRRHFENDIDFHDL